MALPSVARHALKTGLACPPDVAEDIAKRLDQISPAAANQWGVFGSSQALPAAYTQTHSTASRTSSSLTASAIGTTAASTSTPFGYTTLTQANAIPTAINALVADILNVKNVLTQVIDDLQGYGALQ